MFNDGAFSQAGRLYEKVLEKNPESRIAINNLAHCYLEEKRYEKAKTYFEKAAGFSQENSNNHYFLAKTHFLLGNYTEAQSVLERYLIATGEDPEAARLLAWCHKVQDFPEASEFEIRKLLSINSPYADFAPVVHNAGLVFTTERKQDAGEEEFAIENRPFTNVYYAPFSNEKKTSFWDPRVFSENLKTRFHDGPACFNAAGDEVYYTQVNREHTGGGKTNTMKIFFASLDEDKWLESKEFAYNSSAYNVGHPALSEDGNLLVFSSDMPGGTGGMDLFICRRESEGWSSPKNLGTNVNSSGDEVFPHIRDRQLYFSSNGWPGYGGLDIFVVHLDSLDNEPRNLYQPINSAWDDLSITFLNDHLAFFSSDRPGGMGRDDLYGLERKVEEEVHREISGVLEQNKQPAAQASITLKDESGNVIQKATTNSHGRFKFDYLKSGMPYTISLGMNESESLQDFVIFLLNNRDQKVQEIVADDSGDFNFELLKPDDFDDLELLDIEDASLLSLDIRGQVYEEKPGDFRNRIELQIFNSDGDLLSRTITRSDGQFLFSQLFPDDQYIFRFLEENPKLKIAIFDGEGKISQVLSRTGREHIFHRLKSGDPVLSMINERDIAVKVSPDDHFTIPNIYYDLDAYQLNESAKKQLVRLLEILKKNPNVGVSVMSHTDSRASDQYNLKLSEKRADEVIRFLRNSGIDKARITGIGFGETQLVNRCKNDVPCTEEEHAENRRTEFSFYSFN